MKFGEFIVSNIGATDLDIDGEKYHDGFVVESPHAWLEAMSAAGEWRDVTWAAPGDFVRGDRLHIARGSRATLLADLKAFTFMQPSGTFPHQLTLRLVLSDADDKRCLESLPFQAPR